MASSRIPGPIGTDEEFLGDEEDARWPHKLGRPFRHHRPGPIGLDPEPAWLRMRIGLHRSDDEDELFRDLKRWEGCVAYMYLDTRGLVTVGIGNLLRTVEDAQKLPFVNMASSEPASEAEIAAAFAAVSQMQAGLHWSKYKVSPSIELSDETSRALALGRVKHEFVPRIRRSFPDFDIYPQAAQRFMIDMAYNGGVGYFKKRNMVKFLEERQWLAAIPCLSTKGNARRNAWREALLRQAAAEDTP